MVRRLFGLLCSAAMVTLSVAPAAVQPAAAATKADPAAVKAASQPVTDQPPPPPLAIQDGIPISYHRPPPTTLHRPAAGAQPVARPPLSPVASVGGTWADMGPKPILSPWWGANSGLVSALAVDPTDANTVYAGSVGGGVWKSSDGGANWSPTSDGQPSLAIGSLAIDPSNHLVVYAGTGAAHDGGNQPGAGILKSANGGSTWTVVGNASGTFNGVSVHQLVIDPTTTSTLYASTDAGIYKSIDSGANWTSIMAFTFSGIADMAIDPNTPATVYVAAYDAGGTHRGIFKSTNGGTAFTQLTSGLPASGTAGRISLAISHSNPNRLYATMAKQTNACSLGVWRSDDGGANWTQLAAPELFAPAGYPYCQGWYDNYTAVDPTNPDVAYVAGIDVWKITGAGAAFTLLTPLSPSHVHPDQHALAFASNSSGAAFYIGNDGGVWSTGNGGASFTNRNNTLETALMYSGVAVAGIALAGLQDNGIVKYVGTPAWYELMGGDGSAVSIDPGNPNILYASDYGPLNMYKSGDGGRSFSPVQTGINPADLCLCPAEPAIMDPSHTGTLVAGTFYANVYRTVNGAGSWSNITPGSLVPNSYGETHGLAVAPTDTGEIWGAFGWSVFVHTASGWLDRTAGLPQFDLFRGLVVDPSNAQHVFVSEAGSSLINATIFGAVFETFDLGAHWQDVTGALPNVPVNVLVIDTYGRLLAGTDRGVYARTCGTWSKVGAGLPNAKVTDLRISPDGSTLYASTYGRGMWVIALQATPPCAPPTAVLAQAGNGSATLTWQAPSRSITSYSVTSYPNGVAGTPVLFNSPATIGVLGGLTNGTPYTFTVAAANSAGPGPPSPQSNIVTPSASYPWSVVSTRQYSFAGSDGATWTDVDSTNLQLKITPTVDSVGIVSANADLWTSVAGFNQDIGISVSGGAYPSVVGQPEAWKESGGFAGTYSPNAAYVQAALHLKLGVSYTVKLQWKAHRPAAGGTIWVGAGPIGPNYSLTRLTAVLVAEAPQTVFDASNALQYTQAGSDGVTWRAIDSSGLKLSFQPSVPSHAIVTANADLWTSVAGYNQDIGIAIAGGGYPSITGQPEVWKESGGFAGTFSPNAAFVQGVIPLAANTPYVATLVWKASGPSPASAAIWAGAGPINGNFSPTRLSVVIVPDSAGTLFTAKSTQQYSLPNSDGSTWTGVDAPNLVLNVTPAATCFALVSANSDLWTANAGFNQDIGVDVSGGGTLAPDQLGWKESGGLAGTFSPNAAFVQTAFVLNAATAYKLLLEWKTNRPAAGATIFAGAGPIGGLYSPTSLTAQLFC